MARPLDISVLMPVRNAARTVRSALGSVLRSRGVSFEVVVVEHASSDGTREILDDIARADGRVRIVDAEAALSLAEVLEEGRRRCRAPYLARMDADDLMHPERLLADKRALDEEGEIAAVACRTRLFPLHRAGIGMRAYVFWQNTLLTPEDHEREIWIEQPLCHPATTFRADVLDEVGGYRSGEFPEDYDLFLRLVLRGKRLKKRPVFHHGWREHGARVTYCDPRTSRDALCDAKARALVERFSLDERPVFIAGAGKEGGRMARCLGKLGVRPSRFFDVSPRRIGRVRHGAPVLPREQLSVERRAHDDAFLIGAVGTSGARGSVRALFQDAGFIEGDDAVVVA